MAFTMLQQMGIGADCLANQVAIVTGGGRGIGSEAAKMLAALGASVVIAEINPEGQCVADEICRTGGNAIYIRTDVADEASVKDMSLHVLRKFSHVDILINNAICSPVTPLLEMDLASWDRVTAVNLRGTVLCIKAFVPGMVAQRRGAVVSLVSTPSMPYMAAYACTKQAIESLTHSLAGEIDASGVSCIAFGPGMVQTPGGEASFRRLAPYLKLTYEQLTNSGINPGYAGLMPAADAAAALCYVVAHASVYHNQTVLATDVLEKFLLTNKAFGAPRASDQEIAWSKAAVAASQLARHLVNTQAEFDQLPFFARPMARGGFKRKSGISIGDCQELLQQASGIWQALTQQQNECNAKAMAENVVGPPSITVTLIAHDEQTAYLSVRLRRILPGLATYFREVPAETARFVKDAELLASIAKTAEERAKTCDTLATLLGQG